MGGINRGGASERRGMGASTRFKIKISGSAAGLVSKKRFRQDLEPLVPTDGGFWVLVSVAGAIPAAVLVDLNAKSRMRLEKLRVERNEIERIVMSASP